MPQHDPKAQRETRADDPHFANENAPDEDPDFGDENMPAQDAVGQSAEHQADFDPIDNEI